MNNTYRILTGHWLDVAKQIPDASVQVCVTSPHLDPVWLRTKYVDEGLSTYDIGKLVNRNPKNIYCKLKDFGIPTRPRGMNLATGGDHWTQQPNAVNAFLGKAHSDATKAILSAKASVPRPHLRAAGNGMYGRKGALNPQWKGGDTPEQQRVYASAEWKALQRALSVRDRGYCRRCGMCRRKRVAHHVKPWALCPSGRMDINNLITLCQGCHRWVHSRKNVNLEFLDLSTERGCQEIEQHVQNP